jgi:hypothetical protein
MDNPDIKSPGVPEAEVSQLESQVAALQHLVTTLLVLLVIVSGTLSIFLLRQWQMARKDLGAIRPSALQIIADYNKERAPRMDAFLDKLKDYGRTHPDFVPILVRYGLATNVAPAAGAAPSAPKK